MSGGKNAHDDSVYQVVYRPSTMVECYTRSRESESSSPKEKAMVQVTIKRKTEKARRRRLSSDCNENSG